MDTVVPNWWQSAQAFFSRNREPILNTLSFLLLPLLIWRMVWHFDMVAFIPFAVLALSWILLAGKVFEDETVSAGSTRFIRRASAVSLLSFFVVVGGPGGDVIVTRTFESTSLKMPIKLTVPFFGNLAFVPREFDQRLVEMKLTAQDGVPLACTVSTFGIRLDARDQMALESLLVGKIEAGDPAAVITAAVQDALRAESAKVLGQLTAAQISDPLRKFTIPYAIGTPLGATLAANGLHWQGGNISYSCYLNLNS